jgi:hypothetical protein
MTAVGIAQRPPTASDLGRQSSGGAPLLSLAVTASPETTKVGAPIELDIVATNVSNRPLNFIFFYGKSGEFMYDIVVTDSHGNGAPMTKYYKDLKEANFGGRASTNRGGGTLTPGKSIKEVAILTNLYQLGPGKYTVSARTVYPYVGGDIVSSNTVTLTISAP